MARWLILAVARLWFVPVAAQAETWPREVVLETGEVVVGHLVDAEDRGLTLLLAEGQLRVIRWEDVLSMRVLDGVHGPVSDEALLQPWADTKAEWRRKKALEHRDRLNAKSERAQAWSIATTVPLMSGGLLSSQTGTGIGFAPLAVFGFVLNATSVSFAAAGSRAALDAVKASPERYETWDVGLVLAISGTIQSAVAAALRGALNYEGVIVSSVNSAIGGGVLVAGNVVMMAVGGAARAEAGFVQSQPLVVPYAAATGEGAALGVAGRW